ncbi:TonB-dependent receptor plug domain-containing protein [Porticoccus sp.]
MFRRRLAHRGSGCQERNRLSSGTAPAALACRCLLLLAALPSTGLSLQPSPPVRSLTELSLEELANIEITSVAKKTGSLSKAPASVFVITANDIRRYGANSLPEALRLAPNLLVAQVSGGQYAISARGFNGTTSNKLQVLIDGRIVYTPLFSGVFWDAQDLLLEDIERIEVISGPAAALWGTNAVNGVINVITRHAADSQGNLLSAGGGNREQILASRHGGAVGDSGHYRVYAKLLDQQETERANGDAVEDGWGRHQAGFRLDWDTPGDSLQFQGDAYRGELDQPLPGSRKIEGANLLTRFHRDLAEGAGFTLSAYHDYSMRDYPGVFVEHLNTSQLEFLYNLKPHRHHHLQWGLDYRYSRDRIHNSDTLAFLPARENLDWLSLYGQDEINLRDNLRLTLSGRVEHNDYTGSEFMPAARLAWTPGSEQLLWGAISRSVRTPSRIDRDFFVPGQPPYLLAGGADFDAETAVSYEAGYRALPSAQSSWSITVFHTDYDRLRTVEPATSGTLVIDNGLEGSYSGIETWGNYQVTDNWRIYAGFTALKDRLHLKSGSADINGGHSEGNDPSHQWQVRSQLDLRQDVDFDLMVRRVGELPEPEVPAYVALDMRIGWRLEPGVELSLMGRNLLDQRHPEFGAYPSRSEISRSIFLGLRWSF